MYFKKLEIENIGPIGLFEHEFPKRDDNTPKPVIFVGKNGAGKSIALSHLANALIASKDNFKEDSEVEKGKAYKLRHPAYISLGANFFRSRVEFDNGLYMSEIQANRTKINFEEELKFTPADKNWSKLKPTETSGFYSNLQAGSSNLTEFLDTTSCLYFPSNRYEEPAWLNEKNLLNRVNYTKLPKVRGVSGRKIINYAPLKENQDWLLDVIFDSYALEQRLVPLPLDQNGNSTHISLREGQASNILNAIGEFINTLFQLEGQVTFNVGGRGHRAITVNINSKVAIGNLFCLSTGETLILNIFLSLIRDYDLSNSNFTTLNEVVGIVVVDEIDLHIHSEFQYVILPEIIALFPKVQFILSSHSPLFLMGLEKRLGAENFQIVDLPSGEQISTERFLEFESAYQYFKESGSFEDDMKKSVEDLKPQTSCPR